MCFCLLAGCGGGSDLTGIDGSGDGGNGNPDTQNDDGSETPAPQTPNPIVDDPEPQPQLAKPISAIGPITNNQNGLTINGITFDISQSLITVDGRQGSPQDLQIGQVVSVSGTFDPKLSIGEANTVTYDTSVLGPIDSLDLLNRKVVIMGQSVFFDGDTVFYGQITSFTQLKLGYVIRVSGQANSNGGINASYMEFIAANINEPGVADLLEVTGRIKDLNVPDVEFNINELVVDYSGATLQADPSDGVLVQVLGSNFDENGRFVANSIEVVSVALGAFGSQIQLEGFITTIDSPTSLSVNSVPVITNEQTIIVGGDSSDITLNRKIKVEGTITEGDEISVDKIIILDAGDIMLLGASDPELQRIGNTLIFGGGWAVIKISQSTYFKDDSDIAREPLFFSDIQPSDFLEIWGRREQTASGSLILNATRIIRRNRRAAFGEYISSAFIAVVDDVEIKNDRFERIIALGVQWTPFSTGLRVEYYDEQGNSFELVDPTIFIGKRIKATFRRSDLGYLKEFGDIFRGLLKNLWVFIRSKGALPLVAGLTPPSPGGRVPTS